MSRASLIKSKFLPYLMAVLALELVFLFPGALPASASAAIPESDLAGAPAAQQSATVNDPLYPEQWAPVAMGINTAWQKTRGRPDILIAVLDSGIDESHPDLAGQVSESVNFTDSPTSGDVLGHGTAVAGIIAANADGAGMIGIAPGCKILNVKVADDKGTCRIDDMAAGIVWAVDHGARIINISIQLASTSDKLESAVAYANRQEVLVVVASGNNTPGVDVYPAIYPSCIAVSAVTPQHSLCPLANYAPWVDFVAPGYQVLSSEPGGSYGLKSGTSFAAPQVSGMAALLLSLSGTNPADLKTALVACSGTFENGGVSSRCITPDSLHAFFAG